MSKLCNLNINGKIVSASAGTTLSDAGLISKVNIPTDCCTGQCGTCRVTVISGAINANGTQEKDTVLACQATLEGDAVITFESVPETVKVNGVVSKITELTNTILEVVITTNDILEYFPGQYVNVQFAGFPEREYSPTAYLNGSLIPNELVFHIKRLRNGVISSQLGTNINIGHQAKITGPFGQAFLRKAEDVLVLVSGGTGWAPIWSIAQAARLTQPNREMVVIAGSSTMDGLYMQEAMEWLSETGVRQITLTCAQGGPQPVQLGRPEMYVPSLGLQDCVYVAGPPALVEAVQLKAARADSKCYTDIFVASTKKQGLIGKLTQFWRPSKAATPSQKQATVGAA